MTHDFEGRFPANVSTHLKGVDFPASKQDLVEKAENNGAEQDVIDIISGLPEQEYENMANVTKAYGELKAA